MTNIRINHIYSLKPTTDNDPYLPSHVVVVQKDNKRGYWLVKDVRDSSNDNLISVHYKDLDYPNVFVVRFPPDLPIFTDLDIHAISKSIDIIEREQKSNEKLIASLKALKIKMESCRDMRNL